MVLREQSRQLVARNRDRLGIAFDEGVTIEVTPVDERRDAREDQITAKGIVVEDRAFDMVLGDGGEGRGRGDRIPAAGDAAAQCQRAQPHRDRSGKRKAERARRPGERRHTAIEKRNLTPGALGELRAECGRQQQRSDQPQELGVAAVSQRHVQQQQQHRDARQRKPPAAREGGQEEGHDPHLQRLKLLEVRALPFVDQAEGAHRREVDRQEQARKTERRDHRRPDR